MCLKRTVSILVVCALCVSFFVPIVLATNGTLSVSCQKKSVASGEKFDIVVSAHDIDDLAAFLIYIHGDLGAFETEIDESDGVLFSIKGTLSASGMLLANVFEDDGWQALWYNATNVSGSGTLFTMTLRVRDDAIPGMYRFGLSYSEDNTVDVEGTQQAYSLIGDEIYVRGSETDGTGEIQPPSNQEGHNTTERPEPPFPTTFPDVSDSNWAYPYISGLAEKGVVSGFNDGNFYPDRNVTRAEFVKMLAGCLNAETTGCRNEHFSDLASAAWAESFIAWATEKGIVNGVSTTEFAPNAPLTRQQMAAILSRCCKVFDYQFAETVEAIVFSDEKEIAEYAKDAVTNMQKLGLVNGYPDGSFAPTATLKRSEAAKVLFLLTEMISAL